MYVKRQTIRLVSGHDGVSSTFTGPTERESKLLDILNGILDGREKREISPSTF